jgi:beta-glucanase (GH16 family)
MEYTSGCISTWGTFAQQYGYFEIRARMPEGRGLWPNFWFLSDRNRPDSTGIWPPEIDVCEYMGERPNEILMNYHFRDSQNRHQFKSGLYTAPRPFNEDFHIFGVYWTTDTMQFFIDDTLRHQVVTNDCPNGADWFDPQFDRCLPGKVALCDEPMHFQIELSLKNDKIVGMPIDETTPFPSYFDIDYVRVYTIADYPIAVSVNHTLHTKSVENQCASPLFSLSGRIYRYRTFTNTNGYGKQFWTSSNKPLIAGNTIIVRMGNSR